KRRKPRPHTLQRCTLSALSPGGSGATEPVTEEPFPLEEPVTEEPFPLEEPVTEPITEPFPTEEPITVTTESIPTEVPVTMPSTTVITTSTPATELTPTNNLTMGNYTIARGGGSCVKAQMALRIRIAYSTSNGTFIIQPGETVATGGCSNSTATLHLKFEEGVVFFRFQKVSLASRFHDYPEQGTYRAKNESLQMFSAAVHHSYACSSQSVSMGPGLYLDVSQIKMQALEFDGNEFGPEDLCPGDRDHQIALVVGVLALVVVVIVIAVCVLWRRRRLDGYQPL
uniref:Lysosome-associated membrane glycoprotein 2-like luminal domain-containing protein n=1 Tax=Paramormyrops kingsleyae TaxID=1676925 RepID=A0A3B3RPI6_9TELE